MFEVPTRVMDTPRHVNEVDPTRSTTARGASCWAGRPLSNSTCGLTISHRQFNCEILITATNLCLSLKIAIICHERPISSINEQRGGRQSSRLCLTCYLTTSNWGMAGIFLPRPKRRKITIDMAMTVRLAGQTWPCKGEIGNEMGKWSPRRVKIQFSSSKKKLQ